MFLVQFSISKALNRQSLSFNCQPVTEELKGCERFAISESADALKGKQACGE